LSPQSQQPATPPSFEGFLADQNLTAVAIVDDSYDHWSMQSMNTMEADELWSLIETDQEAKEILLAHAPDVASGADLNAHMLNEVCEATGADNALLKVIMTSTFWQGIDQKAGAVKRIQTLLTDSYKLSVHTQGISVEPSEILDVQVVFLDWRLGADHDPDSKRKAATAARSIYQAFPHGKKPIIVLMSDDSDLKLFSSDFRRQSDLIEGLFRAIPKHDLRDPQTLALHMLAISDSLRPAHVVQRFTDALINRAKAAAAEFEESIRDLSLSDYANIRHLSLKADGHPLGDYMCWLFSGFLSDIWFGKAIADERELLDKFDFERMVAAPEQPSGTLARIYHSAVFDMGVGPVKDHPQARAAEDGRIAFPQLALGDIFIRKQEITSATRAAGEPDPAKTEAIATDGELSVDPEPSKSTEESSDSSPAATVEPAKSDAVAAAESDPKTAEEKTPERTPPPPPDLFVVMNAQCDLSMSPGNDREIAATDSILLVPGRLRALDEKGGDGGKGVAVTPLFLHETINAGRGSWVEWDLAALKTVEYGSFEQWMNGAQIYERIARMRPLHALAMQRLLADRGTRVGVPSTPPIYRKLGVSVQYYSNKTLISESPEESGLVILAGNSPRTQKRLISLTIPCLQKIRAAMIGLRSKPSGKPSHKELDTAIMDAKTWRELTAPFELPEKGKVFFVDMLAVVPARMRDDTVKSPKTIARLVVNLDESELA
jgi:hypothetical protein